MSSSSEKRSGLLPGLAVLLLIGGIAAGLIWLAYAKPNEPEAQVSPPVKVSAERIQPQDSFTINRTFVGRIEGRRQSQVGFELSGTVEAVEADEGARIEAGRTVARLDTARLKARRAELEAVLADAEAQLSRAQKDYERRVNAGAPAFSEAAIDRALEERDRARAQVNRAKAQIQSVDVDLEKSTLRAPFDSVVIRRMADEGDVVSPGTPVLVLLEAVQPEARVGLAGKGLKALQKGQATTVDVDGREIQAKVRDIVPNRDLRSRTVDAILALDTSWSEVNTGDLVRLTISREVPSPGAWIPVSALTESARGLFAVYLALPKEGAPKDYSVERREVEVLHQTESRAYVAGAFPAESLLVTEGLHKVVPDLTVQVEPMAGV